jgi:bisphosphoglycerate-dependent phosphoglycerate mutase family 1
MVNYIYLFRHGQSTYNRDGKFTGWKDAHLTAKGKSNAKAIALKLKGKKIDVAIRTRLSRSKETLEIVLKSHPECKKIIEDDRMIERSYGVLEGTTHEAFIKKIGEKAYNLLVYGDALENISDRKLIKEIENFLGNKEYDMIHRGYNVRVPKGESFADVEKRVKPFITWLKIYVRKNKVNVAISAHGNSIRIFRKIFENTSREEASKWFIPYDKIFVYRIN